MLVAFLRRKGDDPVAGEGRRFRFHGAFDSKKDAKKKEKEVRDSFILKRGNRYYVVTERKTRFF
jgi:hypothetical protein